MRIISTAALVAQLFSSSVASAVEGGGGSKGLEPGARPLNSAVTGGQNPSAQGKPGRPTPYFDDEEDDFGFDDEPYTPPAGGAPSRPGQPGGQLGGGNVGAGGSPTPNASLGPKGSISMGGTPPGGVVTKRAPNPLKIDDETGEGSKDLVTDFNFPDADIMDIAKTLAKLTGKNLIVDKDVKGRVTIVSNGPISVGDAWRAFLTALDINGFAIIPSGAYLRVARQRDARDKQLKTYTGDYSPDTDALITRVFPLKYISAEEVARTFRSFMPASSRIISYDQTNTVIVTDTGSNIAKLSKMLEILDVEGYDAGIEVIPVRYASAVELSKLIDTLVPGTTSGTGQPSGGTPSFGGGKFHSRRTKEGGIINTIIADERTNTLIVHANGKGAEQVRALVSKLDQHKPAKTAGGKVHVVYLQFADAEQIANTLNNLSQQSGAKPTTGGTGVNPVSQNLFEGNIKVSPDKETNSLVITASPADFLTVQRVINRLDIPRDQVYVEIVIMEVSLDKGFDYAANFAAPKLGLGFLPSSDIVGFLTSPLSAKGAIIGYKSTDTSKVSINGVPTDVPNLMGVLKAIQTHSKANVLATPQILTMDNKEAIFETAEKIPTLTSTAAATGTVAQSVSKESVSLSIKIKPQMNKISNLIKLDIKAKLADIVKRDLPAAVANLAFATLERSAETNVVVADEDTVVLGGLVRDKTIDTTSKIPLLGDIPILGWLFKSKGIEVAKTNLLIFITPHIVRNYEKIRAILDKKLKERDEYLEESFGGEDPLRPHRDNIIRSLPDVNAITSYKPQKSVSLDDDEEEPAPSDEDLRQGGRLKPGKPDGKTEPKVESKPEAKAEPAKPAEKAPEPPTAAAEVAPTAGAKEGSSPAARSAEPAPILEGSDSQTGSIPTAEPQPESGGAVVGP